jgi:hypothetical protein
MGIGLEGFTKVFYFKNHALASIREAADGGPR